MFCDKTQKWPLLIEVTSAHTPHHRRAAELLHDACRAKGLDRENVKDMRQQYIEQANDEAAQNDEQKTSAKKTEPVSPMKQKPKTSARKTEPKTSAKKAELKTRATKAEPKTSAKNVEPKTSDKTQDAKAWFFGSSAMKKPSGADDEDDDSDGDDVFAGLDFDNFALA